jgi:hypothetical protein
MIVDKTMFVVTIAHDHEFGGIEHKDADSMTEALQITAFWLANNTDFDYIKIEPVANFA